MRKVYPSQRYHPEHDPVTVRSAEEDEALTGWYESPADYGVETCPGPVPDPVIAEKREAYLRAKADVQGRTDSASEQLEGALPAARKPRKVKA